MLGTHGLLSVWKLMIFGFRKPLYFFDNFLPTVSPKAKSPISCGGEAGVVTLLDHIRWGFFLYRSLSDSPPLDACSQTQSLPSSAEPFLGSEGHVGLLVNSHLSR